MDAVEFPVPVEIPGFSVDNCSGDDVEGLNDAAVADVDSHGEEKVVVNIGDPGEVRSCRSVESH